MRIARIVPAALIFITPAFLYGPFSAPSALDRLATALASSSLSPFRIFDAGMSEPRFASPRRLRARAFLSAGFLAVTRVVVFFAASCSLICILRSAAVQWLDFNIRLPRSLCHLSWRAALPGRWIAAGLCIRGCSLDPAGVREHLSHSFDRTNDALWIFHGYTRRFFAPSTNLFPALLSQIRALDRERGARSGGISRQARCQRGTGRVVISISTRAPRLSGAIQKVADKLMSHVFPPPSILLIAIKRASGNSSELKGMLDTDTMRPRNLQLSFLFSWGLQILTHTHTYTHRVQVQMTECAV